VSKFKDRIAGRERPEDIADPTAQHAVGAFPDSRRPADADGEIARVGGRIDAGTVAPAYAQFGEHLSSVLQAANEAAKKVEDDARSEAERLRKRTQSQAASTLDGARRESEKLLAEADRLRTEAENESSQTRKQAETYAAGKLRDAEAKAADIVSRAERVAQNRAIAAEERSRELEANVDLAEVRLQQLATGLVDTASRLEGLIERPVAHPGGEKSASEPTGERMLEETLVASITRSEAQHPRIADGWAVSPHGASPPPTTTTFPVDGSNA
jgi:hypothetical protein